MSTIFWNNLRGLRWPMAMTAVPLFGLGILIAASYESFGSGTLQDFWEEMPRALSAFLKTEGSLIAASGPSGYIAVGFRHPIFLIVLPAFSIATASNAAAREVEHRTILILLSRPVRRYQLIVGRALGSSLSLALLVASLLAGTFIGVGIQGLTGTVQVGPFLLISFNAFCLAMAVLGYSYLLSALCSFGGRTILLCTGLTVAFFLVDFISGLFEALEPLGLVTIYHYYDPMTLAIDPAFPFLHVAVLLATAAATLVAAIVVFQRRDIAA